MPLDKRLNRPARRSNAGFSLTEILVAVFIIGLLSAVVLINVLPARDDAMIQKARADIAILESALEQYRLDMLTYPDVRAGLAALVQLPDGADNPDRYRQGGYIRTLPADPWGNPYVYVVPGEARAFDLYSLGGDGRPGGEGLAADIRP